MTTPRPHAEIRKQWLDDDSLSVWMWNSFMWIDISDPNWHSEYMYFVSHEKPTSPPVMPRKTCTLGGLTFPMPETVAPVVGTHYWIYLNTCLKFLIWDGIECEKEWLVHGLVHLTKAGAVAHNAAREAANRQAIERAV